MYNSCVCVCVSVIDYRFVFGFFPALKFVVEVFGGGFQVLLVEFLTFGRVLGLNIRDNRIDEATVKKQFGSRGF